MDRALELENEPALNVELQFYRFAHDKKRSMESLQELKKLLMNGARSSGWDLSPNIERAGKQGFAEIDLLRDLAAVISADRPIDILDSYTAWREA